MKKYFCKYTRQYSYIFLTAYLFLISLTIFHYHHYNFLQGNFNLEQVPLNQPPNPFDKFADVNGECIVTHFTNSIDNFNYIPVFSRYAADTGINFSLFGNNKVSKQEFNYKHHLRAPPSKLS